MEDRELKQRVNFLEVDTSNFIQHLSINCVVIGFHEAEAKVLLVKHKNYHKWMLPGGFILKDEDLDLAAHEILRMRTGLDKIYLKQFFTFGSSNRINNPDRASLASNLYNHNTALSKEHITRKTNWVQQRFISVGYYALVKYSKVIINDTSDSIAKWFDYSEVKDLFADHEIILNKAKDTIKHNLNTIPIGYELLPKKFTMTELRIVYESLLNKKLDRRNFQRKILSTGHVIKLNETVKRPGIKPATLFKFNMDIYNKGYSIFE